MNKLGQLRQFNVTGMSCAACSARVEKAVAAVSGVEECSVNLLTGLMVVSGSAGDTEIIEAVKSAGYGASVKGTAVNTSASRAENDSPADRETSRLLRRLAASLVFLALLMYLSMGHMLGLPLPGFFESNYAALGLAQLLLSAAVMVINQKFFISGFKGLIHRSPNMDTLVALGSGASFCYSVYILFAMTAEISSGATGERYIHELYFESAAMILALITVGKTLEARSKGKTTGALRSLMELAPETATVIRDNVEAVIPAQQVIKGDTFVVRAGEKIPADGIVVSGGGAVDESALTGESVPVDKQAGSKVSAATISRSGFMKCEATGVGEDTALSRIIQMISEAAATKAPIAKLADKVSGVFVPVVMAVAAVTVLVWLALGEGIGFALTRGVAVLVISCPCALGLATPVAIMVGSGVAARNGILFKTAAALETTGRTQIAVLDKTGTVTSGKPSVTDVIVVQADSEQQLLSYACSIEKLSEHPLAAAVVEYGTDKDMDTFKVDDFETLSGFGLKASAGGKALYCGSLRYAVSLTDVDDSVKEKAEELSKQGKTPLFFVLEDRLLGVIAVADTMRQDSPQAVRELQEMGIRVVMLTGDNLDTAKAVGKAAGVDEVIAEVLPDEKEAVVRRLSAEGKTVMVGDGINDAPALTSADVGIAIGAGTDVAIDAADVVLMNSSVSDVAAAIRLSRKTLANIKENLFWAFVYNCFGIPLAAGCFIHWLGWELSPMFGAAAMSLSSFCVVTNALRLNLVDIHGTKNKKTKSKSRLKEEVESMTVTTLAKTILIEGMMCPHCEATVKRALEALPQIESAQVSFEKGEAEVTLLEETDEELLRGAVEKEGYTVISVR